MMVIISISPAMKYSKAICRPPNTIQMMFLSKVDDMIVLVGIHTLLEFRIHNCSFLLFPLCTMLYQGTELLEYAADVCRAFGFFFLHPSFLHFALTDVGDEIGNLLSPGDAFVRCSCILQITDVPKTGSSPRLLFQRIEVCHRL